MVTCGPPLTMSISSRFSSCMVLSNIKVKRTLSQHGTNRPNPQVASDACRCITSSLILPSAMTAIRCAIAMVSDRCATRILVS